jgi:hypothetical protein
MVYGVGVIRGCRRWPPREGTLIIGKGITVLRRGRARFTRETSFRDGEDRVCRRSSGGRQAHCGRRSAYDRQGTADEAVNFVCEYYTASGAEVRGTLATPQVAIPAIREPAGCSPPRALRAPSSQAQFLGEQNVTKGKAGENGALWVSRTGAVLPQHGIGC